MKRCMCYGLTLILILRGSAQTSFRSELPNFDKVRDTYSVYTNDRSSGLSATEKLYALKVSCNLSDETLLIRCNENIEYATVCDMAGHALIKAEGRINSLDIRALPLGIYLLKLKSFDGHEMAAHFIRN